jgi:hypothetical protein
VWAWKIMIFFFKIYQHFKISRWKLQGRLWIVCIFQVN